MFRRGSVVLVLLVLTTSVAAFHQPVPRPFPRAGAPDPPSPPPTAPAPITSPAAAPTEASLGLPIFAGAEFLTSYDAGRGQRYYLFGTTGRFADVVAFYRRVLETRGTLVFDAPATHMFEVGRFREETMAFPPGVTVKDYTWNNSQGYLHVTMEGQSARYPTIIQIVPAQSVQ